VESPNVDVLWTNSSGSVLIGVIPSADGAGQLGVISGNEFSPLPGGSIGGAWLPDAVV
jgi:hypothetical protein